MAKWRQQLEQDTDLQAVELFPLGEVEELSHATKGMWSKFEDLQLADGMLERAWKEPST